MSDDDKDLVDPPHAPVWRRLLAGFYDLFPLLALWMVGTAAWLGLAHAVGAGGEDMGHWAVGNWPFRGFLLLIGFAYYAVSWRMGGQTIGMRAWRVRVIAVGGGELSWPRLGLRYLVGWIGVLVLGLGLWWAWFERYGRMWHDLATRTRVIGMPKTPRG